MSIPKVVVTQRVMPETHEQLAGHVQVVGNTTDEPWSEQQVAEAAAGADALMAFMTDRVDTTMLAACPRLRVIAGALKGFDNIDVDLCAQYGVWVTAVPDLLTVPSAELAIGLAIGLARHIRAGDAFVRTSGFKGWGPRLYGTGLAGATIGMIGMGAIGQAIATRLLAFDVDLVYFDPRSYKLDAPIAASLSAKNMPELLAASASAASATSPSASPATSRRGTRSTSASAASLGRRFCRRRFAMRGLASNAANT